ncbi:MAG TPA: hypothetical protein ENK57_25210 [Polyangiaceae bacterium]|nr:hypothetical protein [Polyangiaceae bacterium]
MDPYLYVYGLGGIVFVVGLLYAGRQGWVGTTGRPLGNLLVCLGVVFFFAALQGYQQYAPMSDLAAVAYRGGAVPIFWAALIVAVVSASYVTSGGQTSVIMTDLLQGRDAPRDGFAGCERP